MNHHDDHVTLDLRSDDNISHSSTNEELHVHSSPILYGVVLTKCWSDLCEGLPRSDVLHAGGDHWLDRRQAGEDTLVSTENTH